MYGSKSVTIANITHAYDYAAQESPTSTLDEFAWDDEEKAFYRQWGSWADEIHTDLHECLGHGSGQLLPGVSTTAMGEYASALEEATAYSEWFTANPDTDAAGGPIIPHYETGQEPGWMTYFIKRLLTGYLYFGKKAGPFPGDNYPGGGNAAYRRSVFDRVGLYNVELGRNGDSLAGGEEKDIFSKMKRENMKFIYLPDAILYHSIPAYKLEPDYFNRLTVSIGESERARTLRIGRKAYRKRLLSECKKWCATLILWLYYLITFRVGRGNMLIRFRSNVTRGLRGKTSTTENHK